MLLYHAGSIIGIDNAQKVHVIVGVEAHDVFVIDEGRLLRIHSPSQLPTNISISLARSYATRRLCTIRTRWGYESRGNTTATFQQ